MTVVSLDGVVKRYGRSVAVDVDRLVLGPSAVAVLGPNGSGKSTLLRLIATVVSPDAGSIVIAGLDPTDPMQRIAVRRQLGYLTQLEGLPERTRVADYLDYVGVLKEIEPARERHRSAYLALDRVGLVDAADDRIATLSGGMRRRVALAQALLGRPSLLVLDEPEISLDPERRRDLATLIQRLAITSTVVVATHLPDAVAAVCGQVVVLDGGSVVFTGSPGELAACAADRFADPTIEDGYLALLGVSSGT